MNYYSRYTIMLRLRAYYITDLFRSLVRCNAHFVPITLPSYSPNSLLLYSLPKTSISLLRPSSQISLCFTLPPYPKSTSTLSLPTSTEAASKVTSTNSPTFPFQRLDN